MASPGMMQSGLSRQLFEAWCTDKRNGVIIAGYCVEGTLAKVREKKSNFVIDTSIYLVLACDVRTFRNFVIDTIIVLSILFVPACNVRTFRNCDCDWTEIASSNVCG